jgi:para-nitrobenzyl esterase
MALNDPIKTDSGLVSGVVLGEPGKEVRVYRSIPYAAPPIGELRWKPPQPVTPRTRIRDCTQPSKPCPQVERPFCPGPYSEDCLYLVVMTPAKKANEKLPVMVWFHGGGYSIGSGGMAPWGTSLALAQRGVVLVSVTHRLSPIGCLALPALTRESPHSTSGNYLFLDLLAALQWVQRNIAAFGGNPDCVTIFGESGGAGKCDALMASPMAKGLFHRVILQSGANTGVTGPGRLVVSLKDAEELGERLVSQYLKKDPNDLAALRALPADEVVKAALKMTEDMRAERPEGVVVTDTLKVDGYFMPDFPDNIFRAGKQNNVPLITCANLGELIAEKTLIKMPGVIKGYTLRLESVHKLGNKGYGCIFSHVPSKWRQEGVMAYHGIEIMYLFGAYRVIGNPAHFIGFAQPSGASSPDAGITDEDRLVSEAMMSLWVQFARTGDPNVKGLIKWPTWEPQTDQYLDIAHPLQVKSGYSRVAG